jgi:hypothetical protein
MKRLILKIIILKYILLSGIIAFSYSKKLLTIKDESGVVVQTESPIALEINWSSIQIWHGYSLPSQRKAQDFL